MHSRTLERLERNPQYSVTHLETSSIILQRHHKKFLWNWYIWSCHSQFMTTVQTHRHPVLNNVIQFLSPAEWWIQLTPFQILSLSCSSGTYLGRTLGICWLCLTPSLPLPPRPQSCFYVNDDYVAWWSLLLSNLLTHINHASSYTVYLIHAYEFPYTCVMNLDNK